MKVTRRDFIRVSSVTVAGLPLLQFGCRPGSPGSKNVLSAAELYDVFREPPGSARLFVRWWWNGDRLDKKELLRELDVMKAAGIGGVEINPIKFPEQADPHGYEALEWLSDPWMDMLKTALTGARERGIACDMIVGSGWPFGGEFLGREEQAQMMALGTRRLKGPRRYEIGRQELVDEVEPYIHSAYGDKLKELAMLRLVPARMEEFTPGMDLDGETTKDQIVIDVPEGEHELYYLVKQTGYMAVINGAPGASGPVLNHYSKAAVEHYLGRLSAALNEKIGHPGDYFRAFFTDSLELEGANWCDDMAEQFRKRRGYSLLPYLPFVLFKVGHMGNALEERYGAELSTDTQAMIRQVRYDFERTRSEIFHERFVETFQAWCEKNGVQSRVQAYGRGYHPLESSMLIDIPECETWLGPSVGGPMPENRYLEGRAYSMINKFVSSGARLAGKKLISCEEVTNTGMVFNASLERIKIAGDQSNLSGVTHSILHGFNYNPAGVPFPGWVRYGTFFNERNTWWPYFRRWADYKARLSALFQQAELISDVAVMHPLTDMWKQFGSQRDPFPTKVYPPYAHNVWEAIHQNGNGCDYVSERIIREAGFRNGEMIYGDRRYKALLLMEVESMEPETAQALKDMAKAGGKIVFIGKEPHYANGFADHEKKETSVGAAIAALKEEYPGQVTLAGAPDGPILGWYRELQQQAGIRPYLEFETPVQAVSQVHYRCGEADIFFITNSSIEQGHRTRARFTVEGKTPWRWDPETGERSIYPHEKNELTLDLPPATSLLLVFTKQATGSRFLPLRPETSNGRAVTGPWELGLQPAIEAPFSLELERLTDFREHPRLKSFAGTALYRKNIDVSDPKQFSCLRLGAVHGISEVTLNGKQLGCRWYGDHLYDLQDALKAGSNLLEIKVTTVLGNYMKSLDDNEIAQAWTRHQPFYPAGMAGPVDLLAAAGTLE